MTHTRKISAGLADLLATVISDQADGGKLRIYDGVQPASPDDAPETTGAVLLAELQLSSPAFSPPDNGLIVANEIAADPLARASGYAGWFRLFKADGITPLIDGSVGNLYDTADLNFDSTDIRFGGSVTVEAMVFSMLTPI
jgi:hypothetical protein